MVTDMDTCVLTLLLSFGERRSLTNATTQSHSLYHSLNCCFKVRNVLQNIEGKNAAILPGRAQCSEGVKLKV